MSQSELQAHQSGNCQLWESLAAPTRLVEGSWQKASHAGVFFRWGSMDVRDVNHLDWFLVRVIMFGGIAIAVFQRFAPFSEFEKSNTSATVFRSSGYRQDRRFDFAYRPKA